MKIVINTCYGGFDLSEKALEFYRKETDGKEGFYAFQIPRDHPVLVRIVEEWGEDAAGPHAELKIVEVPDEVNWFIMDYDGDEWIAERHRTWS
jgi:hypothetical protein